MALTIDPIVALDGSTCRGFFVRNRKGKVLAVGATAKGDDPGFVHPHAKRYARDVELCKALARLTGLPVKWNLSFYGRVVTSGNPQQAKAMCREMLRRA